MASFIVGNLQSLYPGGAPEACPAGQHCIDVECFAAPCPCICVPDAAGSDAEDFLEQERQLNAGETVHRIVHPFGEDAFDYVRLAALVAAAWLLWRYAKHNHR